jgi:ATP-dependent Clp protease ATP-binding subunit ClpA
MTFSEEVEGVLQRAVGSAREAGHPQVTPEHIALELIVEEEAAMYLVRCGTDLVAVESRLQEYLSRVEPDEEADPEFDAEGESEPSAAFHRVVEAAMQRTEDDGREIVMLRDLFIALLDEEHSEASFAIREATRDPEMFDDLRVYPWDEE